MSPFCGRCGEFDNNHNSIKSFEERTYLIKIPCLQSLEKVEIPRIGTNVRDLDRVIMINSIQGVIIETVMTES